MKEWISDFCAFSRALSSPSVCLSCPTPMRELLLYLIIFYFAIFCYYPLKAYLFSNERKEGNGSGWEGKGEEPGGVE